MHKVVRGDLACFNNAHMEIMQQLLSESKFNDVQELVTSSRLSHNYSDTMYSVSFRTNRDILIKALSFWGPFRQQRENYNIKIIFTQYKSANFPLASETGKDEIVLEQFSSSAQAECCKPFLVQCPKAVRVSGGKWIRIRFQLNGADTCVCSSISNYYSVDDCDTEFEFFDSSHQMPEIYFQVIH